MTITMIVMVLFGGKGTVWGPVLGAVVLFVAQELVWALFPYVHQLLFVALIVGVGLPSPRASRVFMNGELVEGPRPWRIALRRIGRTFQIIRVFPELTALENLLVVTRGDRTGAERRARELLGFVKLERLANEY